jgi:hypothetical protein
MANGQLKPEIVSLLTTMSYYMKVYHTIFPLELLSKGNADNTFWPLIYALARHGVYAVEDGGLTVNHVTLSQTAPFKESSHLALQDAVMRAYIAAVVTIPHVVRTVRCISHVLQHTSHFKCVYVLCRRISALHSASELPSSSEDALLLWLCKVSEAVTYTNDLEMAVLIKEQNGISGSLVVAQPRGLMDAVTGGQSLAALLVYYRRQEYAFKGLYVLDQRRLNTAT